MTIGRPPQQGQGIGMPDFVWLNGLAGGNNYYTQDVAAPNAASQATATIIGMPNAQGIEAALVRVTSSVANGSLQLPQAAKGKALMVMNATANALQIFASPVVNKITGALDTINGAVNANNIGMAALVATGVQSNTLFFCPADGVWAALRGG